MPRVVAPTRQNRKRKENLRGVILLHQIIAMGLTATSRCIFIPLSSAYRTSSFVHTRTWYFSWPVRSLSLFRRKDLLFCAVIDAFPAFLWGRLLPINVFALYPWKIFCITYVSWSTTTDETNKSWLRQFLSNASWPLSHTQRRIPSLPVPWFYNVSDSDASMVVTARPSTIFYHTLACGDLQICIYERRAYINLDRLHNHAVPTWKR